jgi:hypothetical protein
MSKLAPVILRLAKSMFPIFVCISVTTSTSNAQDTKPTLRSQNECQIYFGNIASKIDYIFDNFEYPIPAFSHYLDNLSKSAPECEKSEIASALHESKYFSNTSTGLSFLFTDCKYIIAWIIYYPNKRLIAGDSRALKTSRDFEEIRSANPRCR